jgi:hypothetical protein
MKFDKQNFKELLDNGANLVMDDNIPVEYLQFLAQFAFMKRRQITIIAREKGLEDLKRIASDRKGYVTIDISSR